MRKNVLSVLAALTIVTTLVRGAQTERPNILWLTSENNGISWVRCYGNKNARTPVIDQLANEGFRYTHCFDNAAVCAPTRSSWITGMNAVLMGGGYCAIGDSPHGPFTYNHVINPEQKQDHHSMVVFNGQWYFFYHVQDWNGGTGYRRNAVFSFRGGTPSPASADSEDAVPPCDITGIMCSKC